jgi:hypothetical protein
MGMTGDECAPYWDLGWTWSKPAIARIAIHNAGEPTNPDDTFVAFFGGGWDKQESDLTGNFVYGVDIETGAIVYKQPIGVSVPGSFAALDSDLDGFHDRIYFGDSNGSLWRIGYPPPNDPASTGVGAATLTRIYDFRADFAARQQFFMRRSSCLPSSTARAFTWAITLGRATARTCSSRTATSAPTSSCSTSATTTRTAQPVGFDYGADRRLLVRHQRPRSGNGSFGWYMTMRPNERTTFESTVISGHVCSRPSSRATTWSPATRPTSVGAAVAAVAAAWWRGGADPDGPDLPRAGIGRVYDLWFQCGNGTTTEFNQFITGNTGYTISGTTYVTFPRTSRSPATQEFVNPTGYTVTNWRQE